jgi:hypothetical protein
MYLRCALSAVLFVFAPTLSAQVSPVYVEPAPNRSRQLVAAPLLTESMLDGYVGLMEWYFELRFSPDERAQYDAFLIDDWRTNPTYRENILAGGRRLQAIRAQAFLQASSERASARASGAQEQAMLQMLGGGGAPRELRNVIRASAAGGQAESQFLLRTIESHERPLVQTRDRSAMPFTRQHVDALTDLLVFRANAVAGRRVIQSTEAMRDQMRRFLVEYWNANPTRHAELSLWLSGSRTSWQVIQHAGSRWPSQAMTPYQLRRELRSWADQVSTWFPALRDIARVRVDEYTAYVARMPVAEMAMELQLQSQRFALDASAVTSLRSQLVKQHAVNLNGIEGIGGGRVWEYRTITQRP